MKQILQNLGSGLTELAELPSPAGAAGHVLIKTRASLVSLGTERMLVEFGKANLIQKARQQPEKVKQVLDKIRSDGMIPTLEAVFKKLDQPLPLGYCNAGVVLDSGPNPSTGEISVMGCQQAEGQTTGVASTFRPGDRVASNGPHAEIVCVAKNLVARIPENVSDEEASFAVVGAVGLQGIRLLKPAFGETMVVLGLGLIGQIAAQLLRANGCRVIGVDFDQMKVDLATSKGIAAINPSSGADPIGFVLMQTGGVGADGVLITASSKSEDVMAQCAQMSRKRGRIVLVGVVPLNIKRADFYEKELSFQVSCSYGPGRYDPDYEQKGVDYPLPFVRWTQNRNFRAVLEAISFGMLDVKCLITDRIKLENFQQIYGKMGAAKRSSSIASILTYPAEEGAMDRVFQVTQGSFCGSKGVLAIVGAGNFTKMTMLPALRAKGTTANLKYIVSSRGVTGTALAKKYGIGHSSTSYEAVLEDSEVDAVIIATRHNQHASMALQGLRAGMHVFVEKPLCLRWEELGEIQEFFNHGRARNERMEVGAEPESFGVAGAAAAGEAWSTKNDGQGTKNISATLMVGFNRRFSAHARKMKELVGNQPGPMNVVATMNAGHIPPEVWVHDLAVGGGRVIGEACHFVDLITFLTGSLVSEVCMAALGARPDANSDNASILLKYRNGALGVVNYFANGSKAYSKERVELHSQNRTLILDNFRLLVGYGFKGFDSMKTRQDKGHDEQFRMWNQRIQSGGEPLIPLEELLNTTEASIAALESLQTRQWVKLDNHGAS